MKKGFIAFILSLTTFCGTVTAFAETVPASTQTPAAPTETVTAEPTASPEAVQTAVPAVTLTEEPTTTPTVEPTETPTAEPTEEPFEQAIYYLYDGQPVELAPPARLIDDTAMIPIRQVAEHIGFKVTYDEKWNSVVLELGDKVIYYNIDSAYTTAFGTDLFAVKNTVNIDGTAYVALRTFAEILGSELYIKDEYRSLTIDMSCSTVVKDYYDSIPVNQWGISSRTGYMVWVSKSEYKVRLYEGSQYHWTPVLEAPCAIGAPGTPTITGSFEYKYKDRWNYNSYYVGPCLVFYGGYALHSVLLRYDGSEYDGRVGVQISHGCVRMKKKDIDYIASVIPVGTRIYLTD